MGQAAGAVAGAARSSATGRSRVGIWLVAGMMAVSFLVVIASPASGETTCGGLVPDITGDDGDNVLIGDSGPNVILGLGGDDYIEGGGGNDVICGGSGADEIYGGAGNDQIRGGDNGDLIYGGDGNDDLRGYGGYDTIYGGDGDDSLRGHKGNDKLFGHSGNDTLAGGDGHDRIEGNSGGDDISGDEGNDVLSGGKGRDTLRGDGGSDEINGGKYHDRLLGGPEDDALDGGEGDDFLRGGQGADRLVGGQGADELEGSSGSDLIWGGSESDVARAGSDADWCNAETEVDCEAELADLAMDRFVVNQAVPAADSDVSSSQRIATVRDRGGIVRAFVGLDASGATPTPVVRMHWRSDTAGSGSIDMNAPGLIPQEPAQSDLDDTFNAVFDEGFIKAGMEVYFEIDPADVVVEIDENNNRFPASGWRSLGAKSVPRLDITFVPITLNGSTPSFDVAAGYDLIDETVRMHPIGDVDIKVRAPYVFNGTSQDDWVKLLQELAVLRDQDGSNRMYYGVLPTSISSGIGGIGYIGYPVAHGLENGSIVAHELGHNFNLPHAPCGGPAGPDQDYPYANAAIGSWGYDMESGTLKSPDTYRDLMSYCNPEWISDYNYENVFDYRRVSGYSTATAPAAGETVMMITGSISGEIEHDDPGQVLTLADAASASGTITTVTEAPAMIKRRPGAFTLSGYDGNGHQLFATPFAPIEVADGPASSEGTLHFMVTVSLDSGAVDTLAEVRIVHGGTVVAIERTGFTDAG